ncbi:hypothetical protein [Rugamonas sp.]|uniref:hypothetical protein n=1 Tax=Rugamonas sp. TaxID=1926287 RepID=UPI0025ECC83D|nr:hypothetical protein [Rugamonas sp.]
MDISAARITTTVTTIILGAALALLAGCAAMHDDDATAGAPASCAQEDRPLTGTNISHHDCKRHGDIVTTTGADVLDGARTSGGSTMGAMAR